jgi:hypothetical protein
MGLLSSLKLNVTNAGSSLAGEATTPSFVESQSSRKVGASIITKLFMSRLKGELNDY